MIWTWHGTLTLNVMISRNMTQVSYPLVPPTLVLCVFGENQTIASFAVGSFQHIFLNDTISGYLWLPLYHSHDTICLCSAGETIQTTFNQPPSVWLGGTPSTLVPPPGVDPSFFASFQGCTFNFAHTDSATRPLMTFAPTASIANR